MISLVYSLQGNTLYNYYYSQALDPTNLYYKNLIPNNTDVSAFQNNIDIWHYLAKDVANRFFTDMKLTEITNVWIGPMQIRKVIIIYIYIKSIYFKNIINTQLINIIFM